MRQSVEFFENFSQLTESSLFRDLDLICFNQFSKSDDGQSIIFCKMDWLHRLFDLIRPLSSEFTLIVGNSDFCFGHQYHPAGEALADEIPENVKRLFCQNNLIPSNHRNFERVKSLPVGIENFIECRRPGHGSFINTGIAKAHYLPAFKLLSSTIEPQNLIYANFTIRPGCQSEQHRVKTMNICKKLAHVTWRDADLSLTDFFCQVLGHKAVVCAQGNGPGDNHRIYEVLYLDRIPITFNRVLYERLHKNFPVVCLDDPLELAERVSIERMITEASTMIWDRSLLSYSAWLKAYDLPIFASKGNPHEDQI